MWSLPPFGYLRKFGGLKFLVSLELTNAEHQ